MEGSGREGRKVGGGGNRHSDPSAQQRARFLPSDEPSSYRLDLIRFLRNEWNCPVEPQKAAGGASGKNEAASGHRLEVGVQRMQPHPPRGLSARHSHGVHRSLFRVPEPSLWGALSSAPLPANPAALASRLLNSISRPGAPGWALSCSLHRGLGTSQSGPGVCGGLPSRVLLSDCCPQCLLSSLKTLPPCTCRGFDFFKWEDESGPCFSMAGGGHSLP